MNMTDVATWGQLISSAAVLVTLIYLSIQTRQTATLLRSEARQSMIDVDMQILGFNFNSPSSVIDLYGDGEMSLEDKGRLWAYLTAFMRSREHHWFQYQDGVLDEATWRSYQGPIGIVLGTQRARAWWNKIGRHTLDSKFVETVDGFIKGQPDTDYLDRVLSM